MTKEVHNFSQFLHSTWFNVIKIDHILKIINKYRGKEIRQEDSGILWLII